MVLCPLPDQPADVPWPTETWPRGEPAVSDGEAFSRTADTIFDLTEAQGVTYGLLVVQGGKLVFERYGAGASAMYLQYSWSMAKSVTQALVGRLVAEGRLDIQAPAPVPEWAGDERSTITLDQLLRMSSGLAWNEDYVDGSASDVIPMLSFEGRHDTGAFAAAKPLAHPPGAVWSYSSGTTNIICRILRDVVGGPTEMLQFMRDTLFDPLGMRSPVPKFDDAGTFIGSSFLFATPQDFARFGYLYLRGGAWDGKAVLPRDWIDYARTPTHNDGEAAYGAHWWMRPQRPDWFYCSGYDGQRVLLVPEKDAVIVRVGRTPAAEIDAIWHRVDMLGDLLLPC